MRTRTSLAPTVSKRADKATAWGYTLVNLAALPGLGSVAAGRKIGYLQALVALTGFGLSLAWMVIFVLEWRAEGRFPADFRPSLLIGIAGMVLYGIAWFWSLGTSLSLQREARSNPAPPPVAHEPSRSPNTPPKL